MLCSLKDSWFPNQGSNPCPTALGVWRLNHWTAQEVPTFSYLMSPTPEHLGDRILTLH